MPRWTPIIEEEGGTTLDDAIVSMAELKPAQRHRRSVHECVMGLRLEPSSKADG